METEYPTTPLTVLRRQTERLLEEVSQATNAPADLLWERAVNTFHGRKPTIDFDCPEETKVLEAVHTLNKAEKAAFCFAE